MPMLGTYEHERLKVLGQIEVTSEMVEDACRWIDLTDRVWTEDSREPFLQERGLQLPMRISLDSEETPDQLRTIAEFFSWHLAFVEGVWQLVRNGELLSNGQTTTFEPTIEWRTSRMRATWSFPELCHPYPTQLFALPSRQFTGPPRSQV